MSGFPGVTPEARWAVGALCGVLFAIVGCASGPPAGVTPEPLRQVWPIGQPVTTHRILTITSDELGAPLTLSREDRYRTTVTHTAPGGEPLAGVRQYESVVVRISHAEDVTEEVHPLTGATVRFPPGAAPFVVDGEGVEEDVLSRLTLLGVDHFFLPREMVWPGASWEPSEADARGLASLLAEIGITPDENDVQVEWLADAVAGDSPDAAVCRVVWECSGLSRTLPAVAMHLSLAGSFTFDRQTHLITHLALTGNSRRAGEEARISIVITRSLAASPGS